MSEPRMISMDLASRIWSAHREIKVAAQLLTDLAERMKNGDDPNPLDPFGRRRNYEFGVPSGDNGHRLYAVAPSLAVQVIEAHIAQKRRELSDACNEARAELGSAQ